MLFIPTFAGAYGWTDYIDNVVWTRDNFGYDRIQFRAIQSFNLRWTNFYNICCVPYDDRRWVNGLWVMIRFQENTESYDVNNSGWILNNPEYFVDNNTCIYYEYFIAGQTYSTYIIPNSQAGSPMPTTSESALNICYKSNATSGEFMTLNFKNQTDKTHINFTQPPEITIYYPLDNAEIISEFEMRIGYDKAENFNRIMIIFEERIGEELLYQSLPYFSNYIGITGTTTIPVSDLKEGIYNSIKCYFINEITGGISLELCPDYDLNIISYIIPSEIPIFHLKIKSWLAYYSEHSEKFETSTLLFTNMAETFEPMIFWIGNTILFFQDYFNPSEAGEKGETTGEAVAIARGHLETIDDFFGGLPLSTIFIFYLITAIVVIVYRLVRGILTIIIP